MIALRSRRVGVASTLVLVLVATLLVWFATRADGESVRKADLNDGGVWVSNAAQSRFGRMNKPAAQLDAAVAATTPDHTGLDVLQDGAAVLALTRATNQLTPVNVRSGTLVESATLTLPAAAAATPAGAGGAAGATPPLTPPADLRGGTAAVVEPTSGKLRAQRVDSARGIATLDALQATAAPLATVGGAAQVAVGVDGSAYAVSAASGQLAVVRPAPAGGFAEAARVDLGFTSAGVQLSAVGERWVVYDPATGLLRVEGVAPIDLTERLTALGIADPARGVATAVLQQPGPEAAGVLVQTATGALVLPFDAGAAPGGSIELPEAAAGAGRLWLAPPVLLGRCVHAAWAGAAVLFYGRACAGEQTEAVAIEVAPVPAGTPGAPGSAAAGRTDGVRLRLNRGQLVLNDLDTGDLWDVDSDRPAKIDDWASVIPPPTSGTTNTKPNPDDSADQQVRRPPEANPDEVAVRPGRTSTLHVLDNDTDSQGAVLAIAPGDVGVPDVAGIQVSASVDGQTISISVPDKPAATTARFSYWVNNGTGGPEGRSTAVVTVTIVDDGVNTAPKLRVGPASLAKARVPVNVGGHVAVGVLADWRDDEHDPLVVEALDPSSSVDGAGALAVHGPRSTGPLDVRYRVDDGRGGRTEASVALVVLGDADRPVAPVAQADVIRAVQGKPVQLQPLGNDIPGADPTDPTARMRLAAAVRGPGQLMLDTNVETGVVTVTGSTPGSFLLTYAAQVGSAVGAGRFRVDVLPPPTGEAPPVAAPDAATVREQAPTIADVLVNDYSPRSDVLVIQSAASTAPWLRAWVVQGRWLRVQSSTPLPAGQSERRGVLVYTISDGTRTAAGELSVVQKPAPSDKVMPTVVDDQAVVRWGDVVTVPVLDNDSMADGVPLKLVPNAVRVVAGGGQVYATGSVLRYLPPATPLTSERIVTLEYAAYPEGMAERAVTGRVTVTVTPLPTPTTPNQPPTARNFSASVTAGDVITLTVPTSGIDPDGDLGYVSGIVGEEGGPVSLELGRVVSFGAASIRYEAYPLSAGTEVIRYVVTDRFGKSGEGLIRVGIVQPGAPQPPVAVADEVVAAPGRTVVVDVLANDLVPRNTEVALEDPAKINDPAVVAQFALQPDRTVKVTAPEEGPAKTLVYGIDGGLFDPSRTTLSVRGRTGHNNPPIAVDDVARVTAATSTAGVPGGGAGQPAGPGAPGQPAGIPAGAATAALVDVLGNDRDPDGERSELRIVEVGEGGAVEGEGIRVTFADHPRAVPYVVEDVDGARAMALVYVPANGSDLPYAVAGKPVLIDQDGTVSIRLADHVVDPRGRAVKVTTPDTVSTSPAGNLSATVTSPTDLTLSASGGYVGPAALMLEVTDATGADDPAPRTAYVIVPVQVGPLTPMLRCPSWEVNVVADAPPRVVDIPRLCSAWFPEGLDPATVDYAAGWDLAPDKVSLSQTGEGGRQVVLTAAADALHGAKGSFLVGVSSSTTRFPLRVRVTSLRADPAAAAGPDAPPPPPPAVLRPARVEGLVAGQSQIVNMAQYLDSPFGTLHCAVESWRIGGGGGSGVSAAIHGCLLTVTAGPDAGGVTTLVVDVSDAPDRLATGTVTVSVLSKPTAPQGVAAIADRVQGGSARIAWTPPAYDGGLPVLEYRVSSGGGPTIICDASPCTMTGLTNGESYRFTVAARNAAGWSAEGGPSEPVTPDTAPEAVLVGSISPGDQSLAITWEPAVNNGSVVDSYNVQLVSLTGGPGGSVVTVAGNILATTVSGLVNNDEYAVRIQAHNGAGWGPYGPARTAQSVGIPGTVARPTLEHPQATPRDDSAPVRISWLDGDPNGPPLVSYTVWRQTNGGAWEVLATVSAGSQNVASDTVPYDGRTVGYAVTATNGGGKESERANVATFVAVGVPEVPRAPRVETPDPDTQMVVSFSLGGSRTSGWTSVNYRTSAGVTGTLPCGGGDCAKQVTLPNGDISVQTLEIQGCTATGACSDWSPPSNSFQPYGPTQPVIALAPDVTRVSPGRYTVTFSWEVVTNGRPVTVGVAVTQPAGETCRLNPEQTACTISGVGYDTPVSVLVTATSAAGSAAGVRMSTRTPAKLTPTVTLSFSGSTCVGPGECGPANADTCPAGTACEFIRISSTNWDSPTMQCTVTVGNTTIGTTAANVPTNTARVTAIAYGAAQRVVATCTDTASPTTDESATDAIMWRDVPEPPGPTPPPTGP